MLTVVQWHNVLPSLQQSKSEGLCPKIGKQLLAPHTRFPVHSLSLSQSPSPISHVFDVVQHSEPFRPESLPSHPEADSMKGGSLLSFVSIRVKYQFFSDHIQW